MSDAQKNKGGRPPKAINAQMVEALASTGAPIADIAAELGCCEKTLRRRFSPMLEAGYARTKNRLRSVQIQTALAGNVPMLIHLGRSVLGQNVERREVTGADGAPLMPMLVVRREIEDAEL